jgi:hypothetical protein
MMDGTASSNGGAPGNSATTPPVAEAVAEAGGAKQAVRIIL